MHPVAAAHHLRGVLQPEGIKAAVDVVSKMVRREKPVYDYIAIRGLSGLLVGPALALRLDKPLIVVRKNERRYSTIGVEGGPLKVDDLFHYIIVDDLVERGNTLRGIVREVSKKFPKATCSGTFLYQNDSSWKSFSTLYDPLLKYIGAPIHCEDALEQFENELNPIR